MMFRRFFLIGLTVLLTCGMLLTSGVPAVAYELPEDMTVHAQSAAVIFMGNSLEEDVYLYEKDVDSVHAPAALVRLMAGAYALKYIKDNNIDMDTVGGTYTLEMFNQYVAGTGVTPIGMEFGEKWSLRDLLTVSLIQTASDAATTLACTLSGSVEEFVKGMNALAKEIGCKQTHFANVTGLDSLSQYTTVRDMHRILRYAMNIPEFEIMISTVQHAVQPLSGGQGYTVVNRLDMLRASSPYRYTPLVFGRTGLSEHEGWSLASVARDSGYEYMVIVLGCPTKDENGTTGLHYTDTISLFRWAFRNFTYKTLLTDNEILASVKVKHVWGRSAVNLVPKQAFSTVVENSVDPAQIIKKVTVNEQSVVAPIKAGAVYGKVELIINVDEKIGEVELVAAENLDKNVLLAALGGIGSIFASGWFWAVFITVFVVLGGYITYVVIGARRHKRRMSKKGRKLH